MSYNLKIIKSQISRLSFWPGPPSPHSYTTKDLTLLTFYINYQPTSPATKARAHVYLATNTTAFRRKLKIAPTTLLTIAGNASKAFHASHERVC